MLTSSVALRLSESSGTTWWLVSVPVNSEAIVAEELHEQLDMLGVPVGLWPSKLNTDATITLFVVTDDVITTLPQELDWNRSRWANQGVIAFVVGESNVRAFLQNAPHVASFIGGKVVETSLDDGDAPPEITERRLASLREAYCMSDEQAREAFASGQAPDGLDFLEWMVLLGTNEKSGHA